MSPSDDASSSQRSLVALALVVVAACLLVVWLLRGGLGPATDAGVERGAGPSEPEPAGRPRLQGVPQPAAPEAPAVTTSRPPRPSDLPPIDVEGATRFQRRLSLGDGLLRVKQLIARVPETTLAVGGQIEAHWKDVLPVLDAVGRAPAELRDARGVPGILAYLTEPRRDRDALRLHTVEPTVDRLGVGSLLRVWTLPGNGFDRGVLVRAERLLQRLLSVAGGVDEAGFDALATPNRGTEVFPFRPKTPFPLAGYYAPDDDVVVVGTAWEPGFLSLLLQHELVHAWQARHVGRWSSRALEEGLAEYLMWLQPDDPGLEVPTERLRDNFAALLALLEGFERAGMGKRVGLRELLALRSEDFYALGHFGYLLAEAALAYIGSDELEYALRTGSEAELADRIGKVNWPDFLAFLGRQAQGGDPTGATLIRDATGTDLVRQPGSRAPGAARSLADALRRIGFRVPRAWDDNDLAAFIRVLGPLPANRAADVGGFFQRLASTAQPPRIAVDGTTSLEGAFRLDRSAREGPGGLSLDALTGSDRLAFATAFVKEVDRLLGDAAPSLAILREGTLAGTWPIEPKGAQFSTWNLRQAITDERPLVVLVASREALRPAIAEALGRSADEPVASDDSRVDGALPAVLQGAYAKAAARPSAVLVVDLADGEGDAEAIAQAFHILLEGQGVTLWNPQQPLH